MTATPMIAIASRHDHYPRADSVRCQRLRRANVDLAAAWQTADNAPDGLLAALDALADAPADQAIDRLSPWLADTRWLGARLESAVALLAADPFARPPMRLVGGGGGAGGLVLAERGGIRLTLQLHPFESGSVASATAVFVPGRAAVHILAGDAQLRLHHVAVSAAEEADGFTAAAASACHSLPPRPLVAGEMLILDTARQAFTIAGGTGDLLLLELAVQPPSCLPIRTYDLASGDLVHVSASRRDNSFRQMALALLRHFGRTDAAPLFAAETRSKDFAARWNAMRELVALDPAAAQPRLAEMAASDPHPEVRAAAAATLALFPPAERSPCRE